MTVSSVSTFLSRVRRMEFLSSLIFQKISVFFFFYLFGLFGVGNIYFFLFFIVVCGLLSLKTDPEVESGRSQSSVWWLEESLVERTNWVNTILIQFWPNVVSCLQKTLDQIPKNGKK